MLAGVEDGQHLYGVRDAIDEDVVGSDQGFARSGDTAGPIRIGMVGQTFGRVANGVADPSRGDGIVRFYKIDNGFEIIEGIIVPDQGQHQAGLRRSMIFCMRAMTSSCGMPRDFFAILASTFARNQAS